MSIKRWAARADTTAPEIKGGLEAAGWAVYEARQPFDYLASKGGRSRWVECKSEGGTLTKAQTEFLCKWRGEPIVFGRSSREVLAQLEYEPCAEVIHPEDK